MLPIFHWDFGLHKHKYMNTCCLPYTPSSRPSFSCSPAAPHSASARCTRVWCLLWLRASSEGFWTTGRSWMDAQTAYAAPWPTSTWKRRKPYRHPCRCCMTCMCSVQPSTTAVIRSFIIFLLGTLRTKDGVKILTDLDPGGHAWKFRNASVELWEDFIIQLHHFLHCLLGHCYGGFLQTCHWSTKKNRTETRLASNLIYNIDTQLAICRNMTQNIA